MGKYPWIVGVAPLAGVFVQWVKAHGKLQGFGLLGVALAINGAVIGSIGYAESWAPEQWRVVPLAALILTAISNLAGTTAEHGAAVVRKQAGKD